METATPMVWGGLKTGGIGRVDARASVNVRRKVGTGTDRVCRRTAIVGVIVPSARPRAARPGSTEGVIGEVSAASDVADGVFLSGRKGGMVACDRRANAGAYALATGVIPACAWGSYRGV